MLLSLLLLDWKAESVCGETSRWQWPGWSTCWTADDADWDRDWTGQGLAIISRPLSWVVIWSLCFGYWVLQMGIGSKYLLLVFSSSQGPEEERPVAILIHQADLCCMICGFLTPNHTETITWGLGPGEVFDIKLTGASSFGTLCWRNSSPQDIRDWARNSVKSWWLSWICLFMIFWLKFCAKCCKCNLRFKWVAVCLKVGAALVSWLLWWDPVGTSSWPLVGAGVLKPIIMPLCQMND